MVSDTRTEFITAAARQFAEKGFYGTSIAAIADDLGLTKQALIHHFGTKEKLYGEVLQRISDRLLSRIIQASGSQADPASRLEAVVLSFFSEAEESTEELQLVMRELLDNKRRAEQAGSWYLKPYLEALIAMVRSVDGWAHVTDAQALSLVYPFLGAVNYYAVSVPTLTQMFGKPRFREFRDEYPARLGALIRVALSQPPA